MGLGKHLRAALRGLAFWRPRPPPLTGTAFWEARAARRGPRAVLHARYSAAEYDAVTARQQGILFPLLRAELRGEEKVVLDFGCGPGRFTPALAEVIGGRAIGIDVVQAFLDAAPRSDAVEYRAFDGRTIPLPDASADVVWIALVLGGITEDENLHAVTGEIQRVLRPGGLLFLAENTHSRKDAAHWRYRTADGYRQLFPRVHLRSVGGYEDAGEPIEVLAGRRK
ncbi:MAG TPA: class I SAM-dependent methyltransferase [Longimicrobiaceae bacterium]|nr:class I SAM-dependent methyltransferase [Longimicrobiaceae bacterium]